MGHQEVVDERDGPVAALERLAAAARGEEEQLEADEQRQHEEVQRVDPEEPAAQELQDVPLAPEAVVEGVGDDEAGKHEEKVDEQEAVPEETGVIDQAGDRRVEHHDKKRADPAQPVQRLKPRRRRTELALETPAFVLHPKSSRPCPEPVARDDSDEMLTPGNGPVAHRDSPGAPPGDALLSPGAALCAARHADIGRLAEPRTGRTKNGSPPDMDQLRLLAVDTDDLAIVSAHCQDAVVKLKDCQFRPRAGQFVVEMNRFVWEAARQRRGLRLFRRESYERRRSVLHFDRVRSVQRFNLDPAAGDQVLVLLAIRFTETTAPSGTVELVFAGGSTIRLDVEVIEAQLSDIGGSWSTDARPDHDRSDPAA
jgi:hypothetical protein